MIAISSIRNLKSDREYRENQLRAYKSWLPVFDKIIYYATESEDELRGDKVEFVKIREDFPNISSMAWMGALQGDLVALINADIVVSEALINIPRKMKDEHVWAVTSRRFNFDPSDTDFSKAVVDDKGADFFMCPPNIWRHVSQQIPSALRFGQQQWDHYMVGFLGVTLGRQFRNITEERCIFHPRHGGRNPIPVDMLPDNFFLNMARWPSNL